MYLYVDINGHKKPQIYGRDAFAFVFFPQTGEFLPHGINVEGEYNEETKSFRKQTKEEIIAGCNPPDGLHHCAARIVMDGFKMNY